MKCTICSQESKLFEDTKSHIEYLECQSCRAISKSHENFVDFDEQKRRYDLHDNNEDDIGYQRYFQRFIDFTLPHIRGAKRALDFGCGATSLLSQMLESHGIECDIYDPIYHPNSSYIDGRYDLIVSVEVFEHLHDPKEVFGRLINLLNPDGYIAIQTAFCPSNRDEFLDWYYHLDPTHIIFFRVETFEYLAREFGVEIVYQNEKNMILFQKKSIGTNL